MPAQLWSCLAWHNIAIQTVHCTASRTWPGHSTSSELSLFTVRWVSNNSYRVTKSPCCPVPKPLNVLAKLCWSYYDIKYSYSLRIIFREFQHGPNSLVPTVISWQRHYQVSSSAAALLICSLQIIISGLYIESTDNYYATAAALMQRSRCPPMCGTAALQHHVLASATRNNFKRIRLL